MVDRREEADGLLGPVRAAAAAEPVLLEDVLGAREQRDRLAHRRIT